MVNVRWQMRSTDVRTHDKSSYDVARLENMDQECNAVGGTTILGFRSWKARVSRIYDIPLGG